MTNVCVCMCVSSYRADSINLSRCFAVCASYECRAFLATGDVARERKSLKSLALSVFTESIWRKKLTESYRNHGFTIELVSSSDGGFVDYFRALNVSRVIKPVVKPRGSKVFFI